MEGWLTLPDHMLDLIVERLSFPDLIRFGCVCKKWRSLCGPLQFPNHLPWLIVPHQDCVTSKPGTMAYDTKDVDFFSLCDGKIYKADIPELTNRRICGSFQGGWLMTVHQNSEVQLFNPFSTSLVCLPPLTEFPGVQGILLRKKKGEVPNLVYSFTRLSCVRDMFIHSYLSLSCMRDMSIYRVVMSSSSVTSGAIIMAIQGIHRTLAFYRIGGDQESWTPVTLDKNSRFFRDVTYYQGNFYVVRNSRYVVVVRGLETPETIPYTYTEQIISEPPGRVDVDQQSYILESSGDLLIVLRNIVQDKDRNTDNKLQIPPLKTVGFQVYKLDFGSPNKWIEIQSLGDRALFLGYSSSFSLLSSDFSGCKLNCIYFTDDYGVDILKHGFGGQDMGIFSLEDGSINKFLYPSETLLVMPPPIWFTPNTSSVVRSKQSKSKRARKEEPAELIGMGLKKLKRQVNQYLFLFWLGIVDHNGYYFRRLFNDSF